VDQSYQRAPRAASASRQPTLEQAFVEAEFSRQGLGSLDYLGDDAQVLRDLKASDLLIGLLGKTYRKTAKRDLYLMARVMRPEEVHPEVTEKLEALAALLPALPEGAED
jgi:hypothetical protein